jgi:hypothetical protein
MSLHDILMERAMLEHPEFRKDYGKGPTSEALDAFTEIATYSAKLAQARIAEEQKAKAEEVNYSKQLEQGLKMAESLNSDKSKIRATVGVSGNGNITASFSPAKAEDDFDNQYKIESLKIRKENLQQKIKEEKRRTVTQKLQAAKSLGGIMSQDEMKTLNDEVGFDVGTDLQTGRIETTPTGDFRILSQEEASKKADIMKTATEAEAKMNLAYKDIDQMSRLFDEITPNLKGPIEGRTKGPIQGFLGNVGVNAFNSIKNGFLGNISRGILQEVGVLTDQDIQRAKDLLPKLEDTDEIKTKKIDEIKLLLKSRIDNFKSMKASSLGQMQNSGTATTGGQKSFSNLWQ